MAEPRERGLPFTSEMVRAVDAGLKTETRRLPTFQKWADGLPRTIRDGRLFAGDREIRCPYDVDRLWVRESYAFAKTYDRTPPRDVPQVAPVWYREDDPAPFGRGKWRPPMFMTRWASRTVLRPRKTWAEYLHEITDEGIRAEGLWHDGRGYDGLRYVGWGSWRARTDKGLENSPRAHFAAGWDSINASRGGAWFDNPIVWVVQFEVIEVRGRDA